MKLWTACRMRGVLLGALLALAVAAPAVAQQEGDQYVDSPEAYQRRIEGLIGERLSALLPGGNYVLRTFVTAKKVRVPRPSAEGPGLDLPGFRPAAGEAQFGEEKYKVEQILVRIVLHSDLPPSDLQYIRTVVPILADFRPDRGDRLELQTIAAAPAGAEQPEPPLPMGLGLQEWILLGVLGLIVLLLMVVLLRVFFLPKVVAQQPQPAPAPPPPVPEDTSRFEEERKAAAQDRQYQTHRHAVIRGLFARPELGKLLLQHWGDSPGKINTLIHVLGYTIARQALLPHVGAEQYQTLEEAVRQERPPDATKLMSTVREANFYLVTQELTNPEVIHPNPFRFLDDLTWGQIAHLIKDEPVRVKTIVLSRADPADTARILDTLPKEMQLEIAVNIGNLHAMPLDMVESVAEGLADKARHVPDARLVDVEGPKALVDLMGRASTETSRYLLRAMKVKDRKLSEEVEKRFFMFEAIPQVPDDVLIQVVRSVSSSIVVQALQGAPQDIQRKVIMAFPEQARTGLVTTLRASRAEPAAVEDARRQVVERFQVLAMQGRIDLKAISDAWQEGQTAS